MNKICLYNTKGLIGIIPCKSGVIYYNQVGCVSCNQEEIEGVAFLISPVNDYMGCEMDGKDIDSELYLAINNSSFIKPYGENSVFEYELYSYQEAWVVLNVTRCKGSGLEFKTPFKLILTWHNCD